MSTGEAVATTIGLIFVAGITAGFWLNLLLWIPMAALTLMRDQQRAFLVVTVLAVLGGGGAVWAFGYFVLDLPMLAAVIAGSIIGLTSYARPNPVAEADYGLDAVGFDYAWDGGTHDDDELPTPSERETHVCSECGRQVETANGLRQHLAAKHGM